MYSIKFPLSVIANGIFIINVCVYELIKRQLIRNVNFIIIDSVPINTNKIVHGSNKKF